MALMCVAVAAVLLAPVHPCFCLVPTFTRFQPAWIPHEFHCRECCIESSISQRSQLLTNAFAGAGALQSH
eukprot:1158848-Pelagomonas_calceolata.AAC.14